MAEEGTEGGSWWGGLVQAAKDKTSNAYEFMKKDITEFTTVVGAETASAAVCVKNKITQENVSAATAKAKQGVSTIIGGISKALVIEAEDLDDPGIPIDKDGVFDRKKARLRAIQLDSGTYLNDPSGPPEQYEMWLPSFALDAQKGNISELLVANVEVRALYTQMVPSQVSHADFWQRYYYKVHQLEQDEERKRMLMKRADDNNDDLAWDDDEDFNDVVGSPPRSPVKAPVSQSLPPSQPDQPQPSEQPAQTKQSKTAKETETSQSETSTKTTESAASETKEIESPEPKPSPPAEPVTSPIESVPMDSSDASDSLTVVSSNLASSVDSRSADIISETELKGSKSDQEEIKSDASSDVAKEADFTKELKTKEKGEMVVVGSDRTTPSSDSVASSNTKESSGLDDDWEQDFDIEVSEEDLKLLEAAKHKQLLKDMVEEGEEEGDDWENWE